MPLGRGVQTANLVQIKKDYGSTIDTQAANRAYVKIGHTQSNVPEMARSCSRDLGYYRQTEQILNVLRDNENIEKVA
jgi:hypothetical protein